MRTISLRFILTFIVLTFVSCSILSIYKNGGSLPPVTLTTEAMALDTNKAEAYALFLMARRELIKGDIDEAIRYYRQAISADPESAKLYTDVARIYLRISNTVELNKGNQYLQKAKEEIERAIAVDPGYAPAYELLGDIHTYTIPADYNQAIVAYQKAHDLNPTETESLLSVGIIHLNNADYNIALQVLRQAQSIDPSSPYTNYYLAEGYSMVKDLESAERYYQKALDVEPSYYNAMSKLAEMYESEGELEKATRIYQRIIYYFPDSKEDRFHLAGLLLSQNMVDEFTPQFQVLRTDPIYGVHIYKMIIYYYMLKGKYDLAELYIKRALNDWNQTPEQFFILYLENYRIQEQYDKAIELAKDLTVRFPENIDFYLSLFELYLTTDRKQDALDTIKTVTRKFPDKPDGYFFMARLYFLLDEKEKAVETLTKASEMFPTNEKINFWLGMMLEEQGKRDRAIEIMFKILKINPDSPDALNFIGYSWADQGINLKKAKEYIERALHSVPDSGAFLDSLGWVYFKMGDKEKALHYLKKAASLEAGDPVIFEHLGDVYNSLGDIETAIEYWKKAIGMEPPNAEEIEKRMQEAIKGSQE